MLPTYTLSEKSKGIAYTIAGMFFFALCNVLAKNLTIDTNTWFVTFFRNFFGLLILSVLFVYQSGFKFPRPQSSFKNHLLRAILGIIATLALFQSFALLPMQNAMTLTFIGPFFVTLLSLVFLKEYVDHRMWIALSIAFLGILVVLNASTDMSLAGFMYGVAAAWFNACALIVIKITSKAESAATITFYYMLLATIFSATWLPFNWFTLEPVRYLELFILAASSTLAHYMIIRGLAHAPASKVAPFNYTALLWACLFGFIFFNEPLSTHALAGGAIIIASGIYLARHKDKI